MQFTIISSILIAIGARASFGLISMCDYSGGHMFSGSYDKTVRVWDVDNLTCLATLQGHSGAVRALAASPTLVFSGSDDTTIKVRVRLGPTSPEERAGYAFSGVLDLLLAT